MKTTKILLAVLAIAVFAIPNYSFAGNAYRVQPQVVYMYPNVVGPTYVPSFGYFPYTMASPNQYSYHNPNWGVPAPYFPAEILFGPQSLQRFWSYGR
jgi:hypothetical protein